MANLTLRGVKGSPLTNQEVDDNFSNLNTAKLESGDSPTFGDVIASSLQVTGGTGDEGKMVWNTEDLTIDLDVGGGVVYQLGQETGLTVRNVSGTTLQNGSVVKISGASGSKLTVSLADASTELGSAPTVGIVTETITNNSTGRVTTAGFVRGLNTSAFTEGAAIYLGSAGTFTSTKPSSPNHLVHLGWVVRSHATEGFILVHVNNGWELDELHDVLITGIADNDILQWNAATSVWENKSLAAAGIAGLGADVNFGTVTIAGDLTVSGTTTTIDATNLAVADNMIYLNEGSTNTNPDLGFAGNYNDGTYAHAGLFRDADDGRWKFYDGYTLEPDASAFIDTGHASFALAPVQAEVFIGPLTGNADTASKWATARTITLGGDLTGSVSIDGSANVTLSAEVVNDSHTHDGRYYTETEIGNFFGGTTAITGYNKSNWDTAYGWGNHASAGYLTSFTETDPVFAASPAGTITNTDKSNWNTAYGWGNHATAGYLPATHDMTLTLSGDLSGSVTFTNMGNATLSAQVANDSHTHSAYVAKSGDTMTGALTLSGATDLNFLAGTNEDAGDIVWKYNAGTEKHRLWDGGTGLNYRYNGGTAYKLFHEGYRPYADKWTTARTNTVTLTGDVTGSGSASVDGSGNWTVSLSTVVGDDSHSHSNYVIANTTSNANIDSDWGQSFKTFDPVPAGTPPISSPNLRTINVGENYARRTQIAFNYATDQAWFRRRQDSTWYSWREFIHSGNIGSQSVSYASSAGNADTVDGLHASAFATASHTHSYLPLSGGQMSGVLALGNNKLHLTSSGDGNHFLRYISTGFSGNTIDGPQLGGHQGGELITNYGGDNWSFRWNSAGDTLTRNIHYAIGSTRTPIVYDYNDTSYYVDPASSSISAKFNGNVDIVARSSGWSEGLRIRVPSTSSWGGVRFTRDRANFDGNWALGYTGLDSTDDFVFVSNNGGTQINNILRLTKDGTVKAGNHVYVGQGTFDNPGGWNKTLVLDGTAHSRIRLKASASTYGASEVNLWADNTVSPSAGINSTHYFYINAPYVNIAGSARAPIFYDSNDTAYYVDPNGSSYLYNLELIGNKHTYLRVNPSGTSEAMTQYKAGHTGHWYTGIRVNADLSGVGTNAYQIYSSDAGRTLFGITPSGDVMNWGYLYVNKGNASNGMTINYDQIWRNDGGTLHLQYSGSGNIDMNYGGGYTFSRTSLRAPIFYDSNDTGYYVDPASTSNLNSVNIATLNGTSPTNYMKDDGWNTYPGQAANDQPIMKSDFSYSNQCPYTGDLIRFGAGGYSLQLNSTYSGGWGFAYRSRNGDNGTWNPWYYPAVYGVNANGGGDLYANTYYESSNTGYYLDPAGNSRFADIRPNRIWCQNNGDQGTPRWDFRAYVVEAPHFYGHSGSGDIYLGESGNNIQVRGDIRVPIVYDSNNTGYYVDPASRSILNEIRFDSVASQTYDSVYHAAAIEVREYNWAGAQTGAWAEAPRIGFHWGGRVASSIAMGTNGWINIMNNPGNGYESLIAGAIYSGGDITAYYSDVRLKNIVGKIDNAVDKVKAIDTFLYTHNDIAKQYGFEGDEIQVGVSAQSVEAVLPEVVKHAPFDYETKDEEIISKSGEWYKTVKYERLVPLLIEAIKEQQTQIEELASELKSLKEKI